ncbi:MAG TPA: hypothetical protein VN461_08040 [Vicinamibacteria bacterium]|nr:hypothetical protein [Vicinamibacteria bacterium]
MPKDECGKEVTNRMKMPPTTEADAFLHGLYHELQDQIRKYYELTANLLALEARVELTEKQLCLTRDHLAMVVARTEGAAPMDWKTMLDRVRFVGWRLAEACVAVVREHKKLTPDELLTALNIGTFRFRTNTPFREIHAALLRQHSVKREGDYWIWLGPAEQEDQLRLKLLKKPQPDAGEVKGNVKNEGR